VTFSRTEEKRFSGKEWGPRSLKVPVGKPGKEVPEVFLDGRSRNDQIVGHC